MQDSANNLTSNQVAALGALLAGRTVRAAAKVAGVDPATVHRWLNEREFQSELQLGRRQLAEHALSQLQRITVSAVDTVEELLTDKGKPASVRLRAAQLVIESTLKWLELQDFAARLAALEERYGKS